MGNTTHVITVVRDTCDGVVTVRPPPSLSSVRWQWNRNDAEFRDRLMRVLRLLTTGGHTLVLTLPDGSEHAVGDDVGDVADVVMLCVPF